MIFGYSQFLLLLLLTHNSTTVKLGYKEHGYNEFTAITNKNYWYFWSQIATLQHKSSGL